MNARENLRNLLVLSTLIESVRFLRFPADQALQSRIALSPSELEIVTLAISRKRLTGQRFWDSMFDTMGQNGSWTPRLVASALHHNANQSYEYKPREEAIDFLTSINSENLAFNSKVILKGGEAKHIPLLDFKIPPGRHSVALVSECARALGLRGKVLNSGNSFHFVGDELISEGELIDLLAKFVLMHPVSDKAWAAHQIIERSASLRISARGGEEPTVVASLD